MLTRALTGHTIAALMIVLLTPSASDNRRSGQMPHLTNHAGSDRLGSKTRIGDSITHQARA